MNDIEELYLPDSFHDALQMLVPSLSSKDLNLLQGFQAALIEANQRVNLTRIENSLDFQFKHLIDSALLLFSLRKSTLAKKNYSSLLDFGTGGGIPGVPLAIIKPLDRLVLVDARRKKLDQIRWMIAQINLGSLEVIYEHSSWKPQDARKYVKQNGKFDLVTARAVGPVEDLLKTLSPVTGKCLLLPRGPSDLDEWSCAEKLASQLGFKHSSLVDLEIHWRQQNMRRPIFQFFKDS